MSKIVVLSEWADVHGVPLETVKTWVKKGQLPQAYTSGAASVERKTWLIPLDAPVPNLPRGAASGLRANKVYGMGGG